MKYFTSFVRKFISKTPSTPLGRWNIDYCSKKMDRKIDLANEDHCGPCGQYRIPNIFDSKVKLSKSELKNTYQKISYFTIKNI